MLKFLRMIVFNMVPKQAVLFISAINSIIPHVVPYF